MLSFLYVYSDHSILECYNLFSGVELSMRSFFVISNRGIVTPCFATLDVLEKISLVTSEGCLMPAIPVAADAISEESPNI